MRCKWTAVLFVAVILTSCAGLKDPDHKGSEGYPESLNMENQMVNEIKKTDKEWKQILSPDKFHVLRKKGTERAFSGKYNDHYEKGTYSCGACGTPLFSSQSKYDHGSGWPSFTAPLRKENIDHHEDNSHFMQRIEVRCAVCGSHLGHVFNDGPPPTHQHFCINSLALEFQPQALVDMDFSGKKLKDKSQKQTAVFAAGCFWGVESKFQQIKGVMSTRVGYSGGQTINPTYKQVCSGSTGHAEAVEIVYDPAEVSYSHLLEYFFSLHDPTQLNKQGVDLGEQYRSAVFYQNEAQKKAAEQMIQKLDESGKYKKPIATQVIPAKKFYEAEEYHQQYYEKLNKSKNTF
jgi:peptide methionine sulfoxide reductase msrA/msrB